MASGTMQKTHFEVDGLAQIETVTESYTVPANGTITIPVQYRSMYFIYSLTNAGTGCAIILTANSSAEVISIKTSANYDVTASGLNITVKDKTAYGRTIYLTQFALHMNG